MKDESDISQRKAVLRARVQKRIAGVEAAEVAQASEIILKKIMGLPEFARARSILSYVSMTGEVDTHTLIRHSLAAGKKVFAPAFDRTHKQYAVVAIEDFDRDLKPGFYGILEPRDIKPSMEQADLAVVPGLAFDRRGHRLGRGKGYYDKLLCHFRGVKIALTLDVQLVDDVPSDNHDVPMDIVVTEDRVVHASHSET